MTDSRGCEHEGTKVETASNRLNGVADPEGATGLANYFRQFVPFHSEMVKPLHMMVAPKAVKRSPIFLDP